MGETYTTTLAISCGENDTQIVVVNPEGINNPGSLTAHNATPTYIQIDQEYMEVTNDYVVGSTIVPVIRGTQKASLDASDAAPHAAGATVTITTQDNVQLNQ